MSLILTDAQIKSFSSDVLLIPILINDPVKGLIAQRQKIIDFKAVQLALDNDRTVLYNFWKSVILAYQTEKNYLDASTYTTYSNSDLTNGGLETGNHFPTSPVWIKFAPKYVNSMSGLPSGSNSTDIEPNIIARLDYNIDFIKNGFSFGSTSQSVTAVNDTSFDFGVGTAPTIGHKFIIHSPTKSVHGIITNVTGTVADFTYLAGSVGSAVGAGTYRNYHVGFTENERNTIGPINYADDVLQSFKGFILTEVNNWKNSLLAQKNLLDNIGDYAPRKASNVTAVNNVDDAIADINVWLGFALTGVGSRYSNVGLQVLSDRYTTRLTQITARIAAINTNLGSVSQDSEGIYSGSGVYLDLVTLIDLRISRSGGSLTQYNRADLGVKVFDKKIDDANDQLAQYQTIMAVAQFTDDEDTGDNVITVLAVPPDFSVGDSVKVFDNDSNIYDRIINGISGLDITLNNALVVDLKKAKLARIVKLK